jgi:nitroreductase
MEAMEAIVRRASYRGAYLPTPVPRADLEQILQAGLAAPSGCNKQTVNLIAVDDPAILTRLRGILKASVGVDAPAMICVLTRRIIAYRDRSFFVQDYAAAIQNMLLAVTALGYESCWVEGQITDKDQLGRRMADLLGVPAEYELVCYLPVGRAAEAVRRAPKLPFAQRAWYNGFPADAAKPQA